MKTYPELIVCSDCDNVSLRVRIAHDHIAHCRCCRSILYRANRLTVEQRLALTIAAAVVFALANAYPVIQIRLKGLHNEVTLWQSVAALAHGEAAAIAVVAAFAVIVVPLLQIVLLGWVLAFAWRGRRGPGFATAMKALIALRPWGMVEVFLLGVLVAAIKLSGYLDVVVGVGIWATAALTVLITIIASRDIGYLWEMTDGLKS